MANRSKEWTEDIAKKLKKKSYRQAFFINLLEEEQLSIREAITLFAKTMGNQEFAKLIEIAPSNSSRITNLNNDVKATTLEHILKKIGCQLTAKVA